MRSQHMRFIHLVLAILLTLCCAASVRARAQGAGQLPAPAPAAALPATPRSPAILTQATPSPATLTPAQAQAVLDVLQDDKKRAQFIAVLQGMIHATAPVAPHTALPLAANSVGAELLVQGETWATRSAGQLRGALLRAAGLPQIWSWVGATAPSPPA